MDLKKIFNSFLTHGFSVRIGIINGQALNGKDEWNNKISQEDSSQNEISGGWVTSRIFYDGTKSTDHAVIYDYLYNKLGMKGENSDSGSSNPNFEQYHFLLQTARLVKNNPVCKVERLAQIAYNVGQMLACIDFYSGYPSALQYITANKLNKVESYINLPSQQTHQGASLDSESSSEQLVGGNPVLNMYSKYIDMTPYKGMSFFATQNMQSSASGTKLSGGACSCGSSKCSTCTNLTMIDLLI